MNIQAEDEREFEKRTVSMHSSRTNVGRGDPRRELQKGPCKCLEESGRRKVGEVGEWGLVGLGTKGREKERTRKQGWEAKIVSKAGERS